MPRCFHHLESAQGWQDLPFRKALVHLDGSSLHDSAEESDEETLQSIIAVAVDRPRRLTLGDGLGFDRAGIGARATFLLQGRQAAVVIQVGVSDENASDISG